MSPAIPEISLPAAKAVIALSGALVLFLIDTGLRKKGLKDPTLVWLYLSLLSWAVSGFLQIAPQSVLESIGIESNQVPYVFSPVSSILFTIAAFRMSRVREVFRHEDLRLWPVSIISTVAAISILGLATLQLGFSEAGNVIDAVASFLALSVLACGLVFSFYKYGTQLLAALTVLTFTLFIARQFIGPFMPELPIVLSMLSVGCVAMVVLLFIALAAAWGLSEASRSKILGQPNQVSVICMIFDLRGSTRWARDVIGGDYHYAGTFVDQLRAWAWRKALEAHRERPNMVKFLGDGFLFVWEIPRTTEALQECTTAIVRLGFSLTSEYEGWAKSNSLLWKEVPDAIGVGLDVGSAIRLTFENGSEDYLGEPINNASKMQHMARPSGGVVIRESVWQRLTDPELVEKFEHSSGIIVGRGSPMRVRSTVTTDPLEEVDLPLERELAAPD